MIISASRRTDIPTYYSQWFFNRIKQRYVLVRNPMNLHQVSKIDLSPDLVDCIVFWTKNPKPMLDQLDQLNEYKYYFQFTLNAYGKDIETNVPSKNAELIETFKRLSDQIGPEKVIWRYDPIFLNNKYTMQYHIEYFNQLAKKLAGYTEKCTISFIDFYRKISKNIKELGITELSLAQKQFLAQNLSQIAFEYGIKMDTCAEAIELKDLGICHASCIDDKLISRIIGRAIDVEKDKNQRLPCGCVSSIDIGLYNTCLNGCKYCYANYGISTVMQNVDKYHMDSPLLCSQLEATDIVNTRVVKSSKQEQISLFKDNK